MAEVEAAQLLGTLSGDTVLTVAPNTVEIRWVIDTAETSTIPSMLRIHCIPEVTLGLDGTERPEALDVTQWAALANALARTAGRT